MCPFPLEKKKDSYRVMFNAPRWLLFILYEHLPNKISDFKGRHLSFGTFCAKVSPIIDHCERQVKVMAERMERFLHILW